MSSNAGDAQVGERRVAPALLLALGTLALVAVALLIYSPALNGTFFGDDLLYLTHNPYVSALTADNAMALLDPFGGSTRYVTNYAPVHLFAHAFEMRAFGSSMLGYHVVNVLIHALSSLLLGLLFVRHGLPRRAAALGALLFFAHPANVEAVAWVSQLKTTLSLAFALGALLAHDRHPLLGIVLFVLGLLTKATAAVALPVAALFWWIEGSAGAASATARSRSARWLAAWTLVFFAFAASQFPTFQLANASVAPVSESLALRIATSVAIAGQYLWMALTTQGLSTLHQPEALSSIFDPRCLASASALALISARAIWLLRARRVEAVYWAFAAISFAPVSQVFPFLYPIADRYLYFMLPGLIGALLCGVVEQVRRLPAARRSSATVAAASLAALLCLFFAWRSYERAGVWRGAAFVLADSARHYPDGVTAIALRARGAAAEGDVETAAKLLRRALERGFVGLEQLLADPNYRPHRGDPRIDAIFQELAALWIERLEGSPAISQMGLNSLARAYLVRGDIAGARSSFERALALGGPLDERARRGLDSLADLDARLKARR